MGTSKNNPGVRQFQAKKYYQGKELKPVLYVGYSTGNGKYLSGAIDGEIVVDSAGKPMPFNSIPWTTTEEKTQG